MTFRDHVLQREVQVTADILALSAGMRPENTEKLASIIKVALNQEGYLMEAHIKLRPVDMASDGIFVCGTALGPKLISEAICETMASASRATSFLSQPEITLFAVTAEVDQEHCAACLVCVRSCLYKVPHINQDGVSGINSALCHGCGICACECPPGATQLNWYKDDQIMTKVEALLQGMK